MQPWLQGSRWAFSKSACRGPHRPDNLPRSERFRQGGQAGAYSTDAEGLSTLVNAFGRDPRPVRPVTVAAYINDRARPTARGASADRSDEGLAASTLEQRLAAIKCYHESEGRASPTDHLQVSCVMQGIRNDSDRREALPRVEAAPLVSSDLRQALEVLPGEGTTPLTTPGRSSPRAGCTRMAPVRNAARAMRESTGALLLAEGPSAEGLSTGALDAVHTSPRWR